VLNQGVIENKELAKQKVEIPMLEIRGGGNGGVGEYEKEVASNYADHVTADGATRLRPLVS